MSVSIRNIEKFFKDHPEYADRHDEIMKKVEAISNKIISGESVSGIMGDLTRQFFEEVQNDFDHIKLWQEDVQSAA